MAEEAVEWLERWWAVNAGSTATPLARGACWMSEESGRR